MRISGIRLAKVNIIGFKGFEKEIEISFTEGINELSGHNSRGKTSVFDAIIWGFTGLNKEGRSRNINIINKNCTKAEVIITFYDQDNNIHEVQRKTTGTYSSVTFDLEKISQKDLNEMISSETLLSVMNPFFFLSKEGEKARESILELMPGVTKDTVLSKMGKKDVTMLNALAFEVDGVNKLLKDKRGELKELGEKKIFIQGALQKIETTVEIPESKKFDRTELCKLEEKMEELIVKRPQLVKIEDQLKAKINIEANISKVRKVTPKEEELNKLINDAEKEKVRLNGVLIMEQNKIFQEKPIHQLNTKLATMRVNFKNERALSVEVSEKMKGLNKKKEEFRVGDLCPHCTGKLTKKTSSYLNEQVAKVLYEEELRLNNAYELRKRSLADLELEGKNLVAEINRAMEENAKAKEFFDNEKQRVINEIQETLRQIEDKIEKAQKLVDKINQEKEIEIAKYKKQIETLKIKDIEKENADILKAFEAEVNKEKEVLAVKILELRKVEKMVLDQNAQRNAIIQTLNKYEEERIAKEDELNAIIKQIDTIGEQISALKLFNTKRTEIVNKELKNHLDKASIKLEKVSKDTGEVRSCFEVMYNGNELLLCSYSEIIKAGIEISNLISKLSNVDYPMIVDNAESICEYPKIANQMIGLSVSKGQPLSIRIDGKDVEIKPIERKEKKTRAQVLEEIQQQAC